MKKRGISLLLALVLALSLCAVPTAALGVFPDVTDAETARNVDLLYQMGVVNGDNYGKFNPNNTLTRAEFTKMTVMLAGEGSDVASYTTMSIFPDLRASHWASGYVNLAVRKLKLINGLPSGKFGTDDAIDFGSAVTILMRLLGYTDADTNGVWPDGYLSLAESVKLTDGLTLRGGSTITRAQAAKLFVNALTAAKKDGSTLGGELGSVSAAVVVAQDGSDAGLAALAGRTDYLLYRNGIECSVSDLRANDVATYDAEQNAIRVSSSRVSAYYTSGYPSAAKPERVRLSQLGGANGDYIDVLPTARAAMAKCELGSLVTLLLTEDGEVAGVLTGDSAESTLLGRADENGVVTLFSALTTSVRVTDETLYGKLVRVLPGGGSGIRFEALDLTAQSGALAYLPDEGSSVVALTIRKCSASAVTASDGTVYPVASGVALYDGTETRDYAASFLFLRAGTAAAAVLNARGEITTLYIDSSSTQDAVIVAQNGSAAGFDLLAGRTDYSIYKNGEQITASKLKKDDVAVYRAADNAFYVSGERVRAYYKNAYPGISSPERIQLDGISSSESDGWFTVLPAAQEQLSKCRAGKAYTFLLTDDGKIAGVSDSGASTLLGYVDGSGTLELFGDLSADNASIPANCYGKLVSVTAGSSSGLSVRALNASDASGALDVSAGTLGGKALAANVRVYEKVGTSALTALELDELPTSVAAGKVAYAHVNDLGKVDILVLDNVVGKGMVYGRVSAYRVSTGSLGGETSYNTVAVVESQSGNSEYLCAAFTPGETVWGGVIPSMQQEYGYTKAAAYVVLSAVKNVSASAFRSEKLLQFNGTVYEVGANVVCYNAVAGEWFPSLSAALSYGGTITVYVDSNNVVRVVEVGQ